MQVIRRAVAGVLLLCGSLLCARELQRQASSRSGSKSLLGLAFVLCAVGVLISQA
ncbi:hypothetical protein EDD90_0521 [Streptomyces sp. Ag109_O5-1]|uniref:hypothetical protein n=1 Tax=Streptomyces sp. Ag109_O5-1 TaxID=1938851 RepID=UPI000FA13F9F|nr:hypothetical protein [Streptomyces sp. Ag109_O5-1]RPE37662.1 hypothetical protein EDD90_0521 [Streptomyces sp. Ag109_O5-1]